MTEPIVPPRARGGKAKHTTASYIRQITRLKPQLTAEDIEALRALVGPVAHAEVYAQGIQAGAKMAAEKLVAAAEELVGAA